MKIFFLIGIFELIKNAFHFSIDRSVYLGWKTDFSPKHPVVTVKLIGRTKNTYIPPEGYQQKYKGWSKDEIESDINERLAKLCPQQIYDEDYLTRHYKWSGIGAGIPLANYYSTSLVFNPIYDAITKEHFGTVARATLILY